MGSTRNEGVQYKGQDRWLVLLAVLVLVDRVVLLSEFGFSYIGSDDLTFWQGATDYAQGIFREPYFYGQNYNFMIEALFAVPLLWCGVPHHIALPLTTSLLALFPFLFFAWTLYRNGRPLAAAVALLVPIALPVQYGMLTTVTRGFISGLFFSGFLIIPLLRPSGWRSFVVLSLSCSLGFLFNPNSLVVALPVAFYMLLKNFRDIRYYVCMGLGAAGALLTQYAARSFYADRPAYNVHSMWPLSFDVGDMVAGFAHLDQFFAHLTPVVWPLGWLTLVGLLLLGCRVWAFDRAASIALFTGLAFVLVAMGVNKVNDDAGVLLHSSIRMYLALPLLLVVALLWWLGHMRDIQFRWGPWAVGLAALMLSVKADVAGLVVRYGIEFKEHNPIAIKHRKSMEWECGQMGDTLAKYDVDLLVLVPFWAKTVPEMEYIAYGCPLLDQRFERTMMNVYERRTWVYQTEQEAVRANILLFGRPLELDTLRYYPELTAQRLDHNTVLVHNQHYRTRFVLGLLGVELKRNTYE